jgi:hypothetical protein
LLALEPEEASQAPPSVGLRPTPLLEKPNEKCPPGKTLGGCCSYCTEVVADHFSAEPARLRGCAHGRAGATSSRRLRRPCLDERGTGSARIGMSFQSIGSQGETMAKEPGLPKKPKRISRLSGHGVTVSGSTSKTNPKTGETEPTSRTVGHSVSESTHSIDEKPRAHRVAWLSSGRWPFG